MKLNTIDKIYNFDADEESLIAFCMDNELHNCYYLHHDNKHYLNDLSRRTNVSKRLALSIATKLVETNGEIQGDPDPSSCYFNGVAFGFTVRQKTFN